jgi:Na+/H+-translocating membrane pyrophosphatase
VWRFAGLFSMFERERTLAPLDLILFVVFSTMALGGVLGAILCLRRGMRAAERSNGELAMVAWTVGALAGLVVAGMSTAYILLPILFGH